MDKIIHNKYNLIIIGDADSPDGDIYAKEVGMRNLDRLNSIFGVIDGKTISCNSKEGAWFLQNIIINIFMRMNTSLNGKSVFLESMSFMYDMVENHKKMSSEVKSTEA